MFSQKIVYVHQLLLQNNKPLREAMGLHNLKLQRSGEAYLGYYDSGVVPEKDAYVLEKLFAVVAEREKILLPGKLPVFARDLVAEAIAENTDAWAVTTAPVDADYQHTVTVNECSLVFPQKDLLARLVFSRDRSRFENYQLPRYKSFIGFSRQLTRELAQQLTAKEKLTLDDLQIH